MNAVKMHDENKLFDENGRCIPKNINSPVNIETRRYFIFESKSINDLIFMALKKFHVGGAKSDTTNCWVVKN